MRSGGKRAGSGWLGMSVAAQTRRRPIRRNPRCLRTVRRVAPSSGGHVVFCNGALGVKSLAKSRRRARSSVRGRRDAATSCDQADRASQSRVHVVQTAVRPTPTCAALLDPASLRRDLVIKELLALRYSSWPDWD